LSLLAELREGLILFIGVEVDRIQILES